MKYFLLLALLVSSNSWAVGDLQVSVGAYHVCALDAEGVKCWGLNGYYGDTDVPKLISPIQVSAGTHSCALDAEGVKCWGGNNFSMDRVPTLRKPTQVSVGYDFTCALDADGVECWGVSAYHQIRVPKLREPTQVSAGHDFICALDADGVKCWESRVDEEVSVPRLESPTQVSVGNHHACALDSGMVKCWGSNYNKQLEVPVLKSPRQVSAGGDRTCALDAEGVKCWGDVKVGFNVPALVYPTQVVLGSWGNACALDAEGVKCWGDKSTGILDVPFLVFDIVQTAIPFLNSARAEYLKPLTRMKSEVVSNSYYFKSLLVSPMIYSVESSYFIENYLPRFNATVVNVKGSLGFFGDIHEVPDAEEHRRLAITSIQSALSVSLSFVSINDQASLQECIRAAGVAMADPMNNQKNKELLTQLDALSGEKQKLKSSLKSAFLVDSLELAANWLREKVK